ncbi:MAG: response regulator [Anaerolineales bacterium]|jgi:CheY-like chemotaxis protein|nr:response regulator [Anaerolineales bacterium]
MAGYRVLVVDDQKDIRRLLATALRSVGSVLDIIEVPSAEEAMVVATRRPVDLLIADIALPGISGLELVNKFRARFPGVKIILITGMTDTQTQRQLESADVNAYYYKPLEIAAFLEAVERQLGLENAPVDPGSAEPEPAQAAPQPGGESSAATQGAGLLTSKLTVLRDRFKASAVVLVDEHGIGLAQCGDTGSLAALLPALINLQRASQDAAAQMGISSPQNLLLIAGQGQHLALAAAGSNLLVLAGGKGFRDDLLSTDGVELAQAGAELLPVTSQPAVPQPSPQEPAPPRASRRAASAHAQKPPSPAAKARPKVEDIPRDTTADTDLEALLKEASRLPKENLDDYWNSLPEAQPAVKTSQDVLTWEEARKLGLTNE